MERDNIRERGTYPSKKEEASNWGQVGTWVKKGEKWKREMTGYRKRRRYRRGKKK